MAGWNRGEVVDLKTTNLLAFQTAYMKQDQTTIAMCAAMNTVIQQVAFKVDSCLIISRVDNLPEDVLDELAYELHIDWYDATAPIDVKRALVKSSDKVHMYLGTPYAVEQVVQDYFGDGITEEWYEYDGEPGHFRIRTANSTVTGEVAQKLVASLEKVKRKSAWLDEIMIITSGSLNNFYGFAVHTGDFITVRQGA